MYSFSKTKHDPNWREFRQPNFVKGKRHLLKHIKRKSSDTNALAKQTRSKLDEMLSDVDKLKQDVANAKSRLGLLEAHLWVTTDKCNVIQTENQSLWKILAETSPQMGSVDDTVRTDENGQPLEEGPEHAAAYAARFQQIHNALRSLPTAQLPVSLSGNADTSLPTMQQQQLVGMGVDEEDKRHHVELGVVGMPDQLSYDQQHVLGDPELPDPKRKRLGETPMQAP